MQNKRLNIILHNTKLRWYNTILQQTCEDFSWRWKCFWRLLMKMFFNFSATCINWTQCVLLRIHWVVVKLNMLTTSIEKLDWKLYKLIWDYYSVKRLHDGKWNSCNWWSTQMNLAQTREIDKSLASALEWEITCCFLAVQENRLRSNKRENSIVEGQESGHPTQATSE